MLNVCFFLCAGDCRTALVLDRERSDTADGKRASGLRDWKSSVHAERGLAAVAGSGFYHFGTDIFFSTLSIKHFYFPLGLKQQGKAMQMSTLG